MKSIKWIAVFLALLVCLSGCAGTHQSGGSYNIYLIAKSSTTEFWKAVFSGANAAKSEYNVQLTILAPDTEEDFEAQNDYIRQAVADGADGWWSSTAMWIPKAFPCASGRTTSPPGA